MLDEAPWTALGWLVEAMDAEDLDRKSECPLCAAAATSLTDNVARHKKNGEQMPPRTMGPNVW